MEEKIIYKDLCYTINGLCFQTQKELGRFCREKQYADRLEQLLLQHKIPYKREAKIQFDFNEGNKVGGNFADFLIDDKIILDCKAKKFITKDDYNQMQRYLSAKKATLGLIVNFRSSYLKPKRIINYNLLKQRNYDTNATNDSYHSY